MNTPSIWTLNFRGVEWLNAEANKWFGIMASATGQDKADAKAYLDAVIAERDQRQASYSGGLFGSIKAGLVAPFEALGGSGGDGAAGLAGGIVDTTANAAKTAAGIGKTVVIVAVAGLVIGAAFYLSKGGRVRAA